MFGEGCTPLPAASCSVSSQSRCFDAVCKQVREGGFCLSVLLTDAQQPTSKETAGLVWATGSDSKQQQGGQANGSRKREVLVGFLTLFYYFLGCVRLRRSVEGMLPVDVIQGLEKTMKVTKCKNEAGLPVDNYLP